MRDDVHFSGLQVHLWVLGLGPLVSCSDVALDVTLQPPHEVFEHRGTSRKGDVLVQRSSTVNGCTLDARVDHLGQRHSEICRENFGAEEDLGAQKALIAHVNGVRGLCLLDDTLVLCKAVLGVCVELLLLLDEVRAHVAV